MENNLMGLYRVSMDAPMDQQGNLLSTFELSVADFTAEIDGFDRVEVTLDDDDPGRMQLRFKRCEDANVDYSKNTN